MKLFKQINELSASALADSLDLDAAHLILTDLADNAPREESEVIHLKTKIEAIADGERDSFGGTDEASLEAQVDHLAFDLAVVDTKPGGAMAVVARGSSGVGTFIHENGAEVRAKMRGEHSFADLIGARRRIV